MLNAANLTLIAFARQHGSLDGQIFALAVMAVAASEVVVGLGLVVAMARRNVALDTDRLTTLRGEMIPAAWICLFLPLAGALAITLAGNTINRRAAGVIAHGSVAGAFVAAVWCFVEMLSRDEAERAQSSTAWSWLTAGNLDFGLADLRRPAGRLHDADRLRRRRAHRRLLDRLHGQGRRGAPLLRVHGVLRLLDAAARRGRQPPDAARSVGPRRPLVVPPDRLRARAAGGDRRREEGVHHERVRRRDVRARAVPPHPADGHARVPGRIRRGGRPQLDRRDARRARPARRRRREVGAAAAPDVAAGRDGGPDAGVRPHPRGDDGRRRRLPHLPHGADVRGGAGGAGHGRHPRRR